MRRTQSSPNTTSAVPPSLGKTLDFMRLLWAVDHELQATSAKMAERLGVTGQQRLVLRIVGLRPGISAGVLAETMHLHPSTLTGILRRLTERDFVRRTQDPKDGRRALLYLTAQGRSINDVRSGTIEAAVRRAIASLSVQQIAGARRLLEQLAAELARGG